MMTKAYQKIWPLLLIFLTATFSGISQDVSFNASAKSVVSEGEQFRLTYTLNTQGSSFSGPDLSGFRILSGPNQSTNQSYQIINGKVAQSYSLTFTYYLQALNAGDFTIPPATVEAGGKRIESNTLKITVQKGAAPGQAAPGGAQTITDPSSGIAKDDVFIKAIVNKQSPFQGEQVVITYKIYTTLPISQINISKLSSFPGFWYKDLLENNDRLTQYNETINGKQYVVADLRKIALFAQRSGEIKIDPMELECTAQVRMEGRSGTSDPFFDSFFDDPFFNRNVRNVPLVLSSNPVTLNVKPLPMDERPLSFSGSVGGFNMEATIDRNQVKTNEAINLKVIISGQGNIELVDDLPFNFPPDFETYDPKESTKVNRSSNGISGIKTFEYLIIPRAAGDFTLDPVEFSYYSPAKRAYTTLKTPRFDIKVEKGSEDDASVSYSGISQKDVQYIGSDIRHIKSYPFPLSARNTFFFRSLQYYLFLLIPLVLLLLIIIIWKYREKRSGNVVRVKNRKANKIARQNLNKANQYLKADDSEAFYVEISRALWGYLSNKFNIPLADLSRDNVRRHLEKKRVNEAHISSFVEVLDQCEYARFAPGETMRKMHDLYSAALKIISTLEKELK